MTEVIAQVRSILDARMAYLLQHVRFMSKLNKKSLQEQTAYFQDVFTLNVQASEVAEVAANLMLILRHHIEKYTFWRGQLANLGISEYCALYFAILADLENIKVNAQLKKTQKRFNLKIIALDDKFILDNLLETFKRFMPEGFDLLSSVIKNTLTSNFVNNSKIVYSIDCDIDWGMIKATSFRLQEKYAKLFQDFSRADWVAKIYSQRGLHRPKLNWINVVDLIAEKGELADAIIKNEVSHKNSFLFIHTICQTFFKIYDEYLSYFIKILAISDEYDEKLKNERALTQYYQTRQEELLSKINFLLMQSAGALDRKKYIRANLSDETRLGEVADDLVQLQQDLNNLASQWPVEKSRELLTQEQVSQLEQDSWQALEILSEKLDSANAKLISQLELIRFEKRRIAEEKTVRTLEAQETAQMQTTLFFKAKDAELNQYKSEIAKRRAEKVAHVHAGAAVKIPVAADPVAVKVSPKAKEILATIKDKKLQLLQAIYESAANIRYKQVYNLITKHLYGKIVESGSSHKRIELIDCRFEMETYASRVTIGGFFKEHSTGHNSGVLCSFNLELLQAAFTKAGITKEAILLEISRRNEAKRPSPSCVC